MAKQIGARKCGKQQVICMAPSVNLTKVGKPIVPIPYPVQYTLDTSNHTSKDVFFNSNEAFTLECDSNKVKGDAVGKKKGIKSRTVSDKSEPIDSSKSVYVNGKQVVRCGDKFYMNNKNTTGTLVCSPATTSANIKDNGKIAQMKAWDPNDESLWHKLKTVWKLKEFDHTPIQTFEKLLEPVLEAVLPVQEVEEGYEAGKVAIGQIQDGNVMSGVGALGAAVVGKSGEAVYNKTLGKVVPRSVEKKIEKASEKLGDTVDDVIDSAKGAIGAIIYGMGEVKCGSISSYKKNLKAGGGTAEEMNRDHIPNTATMKKQLEKQRGYKEYNGVKGGAKIQKCMNSSIKSDAQTLGIPKCFHVAGKTYGNEGKIERGGSLSQIQKEDLDHYDALLEGDFSVISSRSPERIEKAKECLKKIGPECKKSIKEGIEEKRKQKPETFMSDVIKKCKQKHSKKKGKGK